MATTTTYNDFKASIASNEQLTKTQYYTLIVTHAQDILQDIEDQGQAQTASDLNISQTKLSHIVNVLKVLNTSNRPQGGYVC